MADIALYVAEDFMVMERTSLVRERREELNATPPFSVLACRVQQLPLMDVGKKLAKRVLEPRSQLGLAASEGFFSA